MEITIKVKNKIASEVDSTPIVCSNTNYRVNFDLDNEWTEVTTSKISVYYTIDEEPQQSLTMLHDSDGYYVELPYILSGNVALFGLRYNDDDAALYTTSSACVKLIKSIYEYYGNDDSINAYEYCVEYVDGQLQLEKFIGEGAKQAIQTVSFPVNYSVHNDGCLYYEYEMGPKYYRNVLRSYDLDTDSETIYSKTVPTGAKWDAVTMIGGRTVAVNQLAPIFSETLDVSGTRTKNVALTVNTRIIAGHKYFIQNTLSGKETEASVYIMAVAQISGANMTCFEGPLGNANGTFSKIVTASYGGTSLGDMSATNGNVWLYLVAANSAGNKGTISDVYIVDLTQWFGSGNEPTSTTDAKMDEVYAYLADHPEYNSGSLLSADVDSVDIVGKNVFDGVSADGVFYEDGTIGSSTTYHYGTSYIPVSQSTYYFTPEAAIYYLFEYDFSKTFIRRTVLSQSTHTFTVPTGTRFIRVCVSKSQVADMSTIQIEKSTAATAYSQYSHTSTTIPSAVRALTGYGQSSGSVKNYVDYAEKKYHCFGSYVDGAWVSQTETVTDISSLLTDGFLENMTVEAGGTVAFEQSDSELQVPVTNEFIIERNNE